MPATTAAVVAEVAKRKSKDALTRTERKDLTRNSLVQAALALPTQLAADDVRVVLALCLPVQAAASFDPEFFRRFFPLARRLRGFSSSIWAMIDCLSSSGARP